MNRFRPWLAAIVAGLVMFLLPLAMITVSSNPGPEIRIIYEPGDTRYSALIVAGDVRILLVNSSRQRVARSTIGKLSRPWEQPYSIVVASADDRQLVGLQEATRSNAVRQVIVVGLPGADPEWNAFEKHMAERQIELTYAGYPVLIEPDPLRIEAIPTDQGAYLRISRGQTVMLLVLDGAPPDEAATLAVLNQASSGTMSAEYVLHPTAVDPEDGSITVRKDERVTIAIGSDRLEINGWHSVRPAVEPK